jgi:asparagine synthase (glutamine-hydrolysing)
VCGIAGLVTAPDAAPVTPEELVRLRDALYHRGPDSEGAHLDAHCGLGIRRLSIIDLETGDQPIYNETGDVCVVMNGELYNFVELGRELRQAGHRFATRADTEVLVHGYEAWGIRGLLDRLNGMFAFALLDRSRRRLFIARDRLGEKPLYYHATSRRFAFASELTALLATGEVPLEIDAGALYYYLAVHFVPGDRTIVRNVRKLPPAYYLDLPLDAPRPRLEAYWELQETPGPARPYAGLLEETRARVREAVRSRMVADVPVGAYLSGGVDSSVMVSLMAEAASRQVETFSIGFEEPSLDESPYSWRVANALGTSHHHFVFDITKVREILPIVVAHMDEPVGDPAYLPVYWLSRDAGRFVKVVLSGEGADEIFAGYSYYRGRSRRQRPVPVSRLWRRLRGNAPERRDFFPVPTETLSGFPVIANAMERLLFLGGVAPDGEPGWLRSLLEQADRIEDGLRIACLADIRTWLPDDLLMKLDKMTMANSLEGRAPYLDHRLVEFAFNLPATAKIAGGAVKQILRDAFQGRLPDGIETRKKQGFVLPMGRWLREDLRGLMLDAFAAPAEDGLDHAAVRAVIDADLARGITRERLLYALLVYRLWVLATRSGRTQPHALVAEAAGRLGGSAPRLASP